MKKLLLLALLLFPTSAFAQASTVTCNSALTQTAVLSSFADNVPGGITPRNLRDYVCSLSGGSSALSKLTITPPTGQNVGISLTQTATGGSNTAQPFSLNASTINDQMTQAGVGYNFNYFLNGGTWQNPKSGVNIFAVVGSNAVGPGAANNDNLTALAIAAEGLSAVTSSFNVDVFGINPYAWIAAGGTSYFAVVGGEFDVGISTTGSAQERIGVQAIASVPQNGVDNGQQATTNVDAAFIAGTATNAAPWKTGWYWYASTFNSASTIMTGAITSASVGIDFSNVGFATAAFKSPNFIVDKTGNVAIGTVTPVLTQHLVVHGGTNANTLLDAGGGGMFLNNLNDTNSGWIPFVINGSTIALQTGTNTAINIDASQNVILNHLVGAGSAPTCSSTGIGASGTCVLATGSSDLTGIMQLTPSGAGLATTGTITLNLHASLGSHGANCIYNQGSVTGVWSAGSTFQITGTSSTAPTVFWNNNGSNLTSGSVYTFNYQCMGF